MGGKSPSFGGKHPKERPATMYDDYAGNPSECLFRKAIPINEVVFAGLAETVLNVGRGRVNNRSMNGILTIGSMLCVGVLTVSADLAEQKKRLEQELLHVPVPELPARAAEIVRSTPAGERSQAAVIAVETIVARHPAAATTVVAAVAKAAPESAPVAAAAATKLAPGEAANIQAAVSRQAPAKAGEAREFTGNGPGNNGNGDNGNGHANGGVGHGPGPNKPGNPVVHDRPVNTILPNGKPRHFPPDPPRRPVNPPRPHKYNKPNPHN